MTGQGGDARKGDYPKRKDYKEELSPDNFTVFAKLREWRKAAAAFEAVQLYAVFTNEQIAEMVEKRVTTKNALMEIDGVGRARAAKYGEEVLVLLKEEFKKMGMVDEKSEEPVSADSDN
jgi:superfamily II DNA helicase RecQ